MEGRREVSIISHRPVTSSDLKQERLFCGRSVSNFFQLVVAWVAGTKRGGGGREGGRKAKKDPLPPPPNPPLFSPSSLSPSLTSFDVCYAKLLNSLILRRPRSFANDLGRLRIRLAIKSTSEKMILSIPRSKQSLMPFWTDALNTRPHCQLVTSNFIFLCVRKRK